MSSVVASGSCRTESVATLLPAALLYLHDVTEDVTCSSVACAIIITLISSLFCRSLVTALSPVMSQYTLSYFVIRTVMANSFCDVDRKGVNNGVSRVLVQIW
jgi:hypothetical protein